MNNLLSRAKRPILRIFRLQLKVIGIAGDPLPTTLSKKTPGTELALAQRKGLYFYPQYQIQIQFPQYYVNLQANTLSIRYDSFSSFQLPLVNLLASTPLT